MFRGLSNYYKNIVFNIVAIVTLAIFVYPNHTRYQNFAYAEEGEVEQELQLEVENILDNIDLSELENYYNSSQEFYNSTFGVSSFKEFIMQVVSGNIFADYNSIFSAILGGIRSNLTQILAPLTLILVILLLFTVFKTMRPKVADSGISQTLFFICYGTVAIILAGLMTSIISNVSDTITKMKNQSDVTMPIVLLLMTMMGGSTSVKAYQPMMLLLSNLVSTIFLKILLPIVIAIFVLGLISGLSKDSKLTGFIDLLKSIFKWVIGFVFAIYMGFMTIQGITASSVDGISIKTAKYAIKNYVPVLGGYISDGFEVARAGALIIKNALGVTGIISMFAIILSPILLICTMQLAIKFISGIVQPVTETKPNETITCASTSLSMLLTVLIGVFIMYFVSMMLLIFSLSGVIS